jgi:thymidylate synthase (FAD)
MVNVVMEINTTRDIARQILRHRSFFFQEFSQRYADPTSDLGFTFREARLQDTKNRQNSIEIGIDGWVDDRGKDKIDTWNIMQELALNASKDAYKWAIENGIAKEQARAVLPEGLTNSRLYMNGTLRSWVHYCQLRMSNGTQKEHREIATDAWYLITEVFPSLKDTLDIGN